MKCTLTVKLRAHSKAEAANDFVTKIDNFRSALDNFVKQYGFMGIAPEEVTVRPILIDIVRFD